MQEHVNRSGETTRASAAAAIPPAPLKAREEGASPIQARHCLVTDFFFEQYGERLALVGIL